MKKKSNSKSTTINQETLPTQRLIHYYVEYSPSTSPSTFTACTAKTCTNINCQRHPDHNPNPYSEANLYLNCKQYRTINLETNN